MKSSEGLNLEELDGAVEFLLGFLILILGSADSNSHKSWHVSASSRLEESVQLSVHSDVLREKKNEINFYTRKKWGSFTRPNTYLSVEFLGGEFPNISDSHGRSLFEGNTLKSFVHVESEISGSVLQLLLSSIFNHFPRTNQLINNTSPNKHGALCPV